MSDTQTCEQRIAANLVGRAEDFRRFMNEPEVYENGDDEVSPFHEYGLGFGYTEPNTFPDQPVGFYQYQLSYGGPSDELRFYPDGRIEYRFHDWFDGAGRDVTTEGWAKWLRDYFTEIGSIDWASVSAYDYSGGE